MKVLQSVIAIIGTLFLTVVCYGGNSPKPTDSDLKIGISESSPFIFKNELGEWTGFDIDLWKAIAQETGLKYQFVPAASFKDLLNDIAKGDYDAALSSITITDKRQQVMDFSTPYFDSGLMIMVQEKPDPTFWQTCDKFIQEEIPKYWHQTRQYIFFLAIFIVVCSHLAWIIERGTPDVDSRYIPGIIDAFYWCVSTVTTAGTGDVLIRSWQGRIFGIIVMTCGLAWFTFFVAKISSTMTADKFIYEISLPRDLRGKQVATVAGTTSVSVLHTYGAKVVPVTDINFAYRMLEAGQIDAIVYDAPTLQYYAKNEGAGKVAAVGSTFANQSYGIALPNKSSIREDINRAILKLKGNGSYDRIYQFYFGVD